MNYYETSKMALEMYFVTRLQLYIESIRFRFLLFPFANIWNWWLWLNRDLNRGCLVCMFSLHFSVSKFLINLREKFRVRKILFVYGKLFVHKFLRDLEPLHLVFKITISKMCYLCSRLLFHWNFLIDRLLTSVFF